MILFKLLTILFILNNIYYLLNYRRLDKPFKQRDKNKILDLLFYINKLIFLIWLIFGIFTPYCIYIMILISIILIRIPIFYINKSTSSVLFRLTPPISIIILLMILF
jgi:hypothetical protein